MRWGGKVLETKEDFAGAMVGIRNPEEADTFLAMAALTFGPDRDNILGYLTGDIPPGPRERVQELLGLSHPFSHLTSSEQFAHGYMMGAAVREGRQLPTWMQVIMAMPRANWSPYFESTEE